MVRGRRNPLHLKLSQRLKRTRKERRYSRHALGRMAGVSDTVIAYLEDSDRTPRVKTVSLLAHALGVSPAWLAYGLGSATPTKGSDGDQALSTRLSELRRHSGVSRDVLGRAAGVPSGSIQQIEEDRGAANLENIERLATALDVSPAWLAFGEGEVPLKLGLGAATGSDGRAVDGQETSDGALVLGSED